MYSVARTTTTFGCVIRSSSRFTHLATTFNSRSYASSASAQSEAFDIHDVSGTVGWPEKSIGGLDYRRAFLVPPNQFTLLPGLFPPVGHELPGLAGQDLNGTWQSEAYGVNNCRQVVGRAQDSSGNYRAFLFQP